MASDLKKAFYHLGIVVVTVAFTSAAECKAAAPAAAQAAGGAEAYYRQVLHSLAAVEADMLNLCIAADNAAELYVGHDELTTISVAGEPAIMGEVQGRAGGIMRIGWGPPAAGPVGKAGKVLLFYFLRPGRVPEDANIITTCLNRGSRTFVFGAAGMLDELRGLGVNVDGTVTVPAAEHDGLFQAADGNWVVPTYQVACACAAWPFVGEFVAACTRLGKMPPMYQSFAVPTGKQRFDKCHDLKWHAEAPPPPVDAGKLGRQWLAAVRTHLTAMHDKCMGSIVKAGTEAAAARSQGHAVYAILGAHLMSHLIGASHDAGYFQPIPAAWALQHKEPSKVKQQFELHKGDFLFVDGYDSICNDDRHYHIVDYARSVGAICALSLTSYLKDQVDAIQPNDIRIDTQWEYGDAVVTLDGYDIKIMPASGVLMATAYFMVNAEMFQQLNRQ